MRISTGFPFLAVALAIAGLGACTVGPDYTLPQEKTGLAAGKVEWVSAEIGSSIRADEPVRTDWWAAFKDPLLEQYIRDAVRSNRGLDAARADVRRARALRQEVSATLFPQIGIDLSRTRQGTSGTTSSTFSGGARRTVYEGGFDASWELDLFGENRRSIEAAEARLAQSMDDQRAVLLATVAETARSYYEVRGLQKRLAILQKNMELQEKTYKLIKILFETGEASAFDLSRAQGQVELTRARPPALQAGIRAGIYRLSILLGQPPEALLETMEKTGPLPPPPDIVPVGLRSEILRRRPDVRVAERALAAESADIGAAVASLFPSFSLTGRVGRGASVFSDLFDPASNIFSIGQFLQWPVLQGGAIRARIKAEEAEKDKAAALYEQAVLTAIGDAETALTRYAHGLKERHRLQEAVGSSRRSAELARARFDAGEEGFLAVLDAERELVDTEDGLVVSEADTVLALVALYAALGGGWEPFEFEKTPPPSSGRQNRLLD